MTIRPATPEDLDRVVEIENLSFDSDRFSRRQFAYLISRARGVFYVAIEQGVAAGYMSLLEHGGRRSARIYAVAVDPRFRGRKIARGLMDRAVDYALQRDMDAISLEVRVDNAAALGLYGKNGFTVAGIKKAYYSDGSDAYRMVRELGRA